MSFRKVKRVYALSCKTILDFFRFWRNYGFAYAFYGFLWWLCFYARGPLCYKISGFAIRGKTKWLDRYIETKYAGIITRFKTDPPQSVPAEEYRIWVFWGQGKEAMPPLIRACYCQLIRFNRNVTLVTGENVSNYIYLAPVIFEKVRKGTISWTHFSDIVRNTLLAKHGGLWLDATVWVPGTLPLKKLTELPLFTATGMVPHSPSSVCFWTSYQWNWSTWCLGTGKKNHLLFSFVSTMVQSIAEREKLIPDYVIIDYLIYYACRNFPSVRLDIENCREIPCRHRNDLAAIMNQPYDEKIYRSLTETDFVFKLSFRSPWKEKCDENTRTFYGELIGSRQ